MSRVLLANGCLRSQEDALSETSPGASQRTGVTAIMIPPILREREKEEFAARLVGGELSGKDGKLNCPTFAQSSKCIIIDWDPGSARDCAGARTGGPQESRQPPPPFFFMAETRSIDGESVDFWSLSKAKVFRFPFCSSRPPLAPTGLRAWLPGCWFCYFSHLASTSVMADSAIGKDIGPSLLILPLTAGFLVFFFDFGRWNGKRDCSSFALGPSGLEGKRFHGWKGSLVQRY